ncbi:hypothetical protein GmHk_18G051261 [Glycine max]|nr:hypothetical protein GmHk_18G051261 [Glycine max]
MKDYELRMPYRTELICDKLNLFSMRVPMFKDILLKLLEEGEDVMEGIQNKGGQEFKMMLKKWERDEMLSTLTPRLII